MASTLHQGILLILREDPWLVFDLLGLDHPVDAALIDRIAEVERPGKGPLGVRQAYPDLVLSTRDPEREGRGMVTMIEVQLAPDPRKRWMIPVYQSHIAAAHELPTWAFVVTLSPVVSRALRRWAEGDPPRVDALVIDATSVDRRWTEVTARPAAVILAGILHGHAGDLEAARAAVRAALSLPHPSGRRHAQTVVTAISEPHRSLLVDELPDPERDAWLELERQSGPYSLGYREGRQEGREEGRQEGRQEARAALLALLFRLLDDRGVTVDAATEARLRGCDDLDRLQGWVLQVMRGASVDELR